MVDNVVYLDVVTRLDLPPSKVIEQAADDFEGGVLIVGYDAEGEIDIRSSFANGGELLWLIEKAKKRLLELNDG